jgi:hypothetical protein
LFALVVGIDAYPYVNELRGCVNDARLIADTVGPLAAELVTLLNADASRERFLATWDALAEAAGPGDRLLVTFSGHGKREPERVPGSKPDGQDETAVFYRFRQQAPENGQRVFGQEIGGRLEASGRRGIVTWFVADSCYSAGLTRGIDPRATRPVYRYLPAYNIQNDILSDLVLPQAQPGGQPNLVFLAAGQRNEPVPELLIDGRMHGALSYSFATALRQSLAAAREETAGGLVRSVVTSTRQHAEGRHHPAAELTILENAPAFGSAPTLPQPVPLPPATPFQLYVLAGQGAASFDVASSLTGLDRVQITGDQARADVLFDPDAGHLVSRTGDVLATELGLPRQLRAAVAKCTATAELRGLPPGGLEIGLVHPGEALSFGAANSLDDRHSIGERLVLVVRSPLLGDLLVASLDALGTVTLLRPEPGEDVRLETAEWQLVVQVRGPAGAGHIVALFSAGSLARVAETLQGLQGDDMAVPFAKIVRGAVLGSNVSSAVFGFFS